MKRLRGRAEFARSFLNISPHKLWFGCAHAAMAAGVAVVAFCSGAAAQDAKGSPGHIRAVTSAIDGNSIRANAATSKDWPTIGLDYGETRFSKLDQINTENVKNLGLMWSYSLDSSRGVEATPIVVDGIMYVTAPWSVVHAIDARTGKGIWTFDPEISREKGYRGCCDAQEGLAQRAATAESTGLSENGDETKASSPARCSSSVRSAQTELS
jgi:glucose dehydrogenase